MAFSIIVNGNVYQDSDFGPDNYERSLERLLGDTFQMMAERWQFNVLSFTSDTVFEVENNNPSIANVLTSAYIGSPVCIFSRQRPTKHRMYGVISDLDFVSGTTVEVTLDSLVSSVGKWSGLTFEVVEDWVMQVCGDSVVPSGTVALTNGGTGATTADAAANNLKQISPANRMQAFKDDFIAYTDSLSPAEIFYGNGSSTGVSKNRGYRFNPVIEGNASVNCAAQVNDILSRYPGTNLDAHPGLAELTVYSDGDVAILDAGCFYTTSAPSLVEYFPYRLAGTGTTVLEMLFKLAGNGLGEGDFNLRLGLTSGYSAGSNEYGFGIRPFDNNDGEPNIIRSYARVGGVYKTPTVGSASSISILSNTWYRVVMSRTGTGNTTAILYGLNEEGDVFLTANLAGHTNANLPTTAAVRPFIRLESNALPTRLDQAGPVSLLVDYYSYEKSLSR
jgi:hypothetical protein